MPKIPITTRVLSVEGGWFESIQNIGAETTLSNLEELYLNNSGIETFSSAGEFTQ